MALGNLFKTLLGGKSGEEQVAAPVIYKDFTIEAAPMEEDGKYRTAGYISGELNGEMKRIKFIRADQNSTRDGSIEHSISKARQIIDEQGNKLLEKTQL